VFGPFHVDDAPPAEAGADIARGAPGEPLFVDVEIVGLDGQPVADASVDVWQADEEGLYDVQRPELGNERRARAVLRTDAAGRTNFRTIAPTAYPVPTDGPVGRMLVASGRHPWRPAHLHFLIRAAGYQTLTTHIFREPDPYLDSDAVFGVRSSLIGAYERHVQGPLADTPYVTLRQRFVLAPQVD
jgi:hydroxyquinol 1,2-dioxygenase